MPAEDWQSEDFMVQWLFSELNSRGKGCKKRFILSSWNLLVFTGSNNREKSYLKFVTSSD